MRSKLIREVEDYPDSESKEMYLRDLVNLWNLMALWHKGRKTPETQELIKKLSAKYPLARTNFDRELMRGR